jgi:hypothetical protein
MLYDEAIERQNVVLIGEASLTGLGSVVIFPQHNRRPPLGIWGRVIAANPIAGWNPGTGTFPPMPTDRHQMEG